jgi:hypothetical protein
MRMRTRRTRRRAALAPVHAFAVAQLDGRPDAGGTQRLSGVR